MTAVKNWLLAFRLKTLTAAVIPILAASALVSLQQHSLNWPLILCLLGSALSIQIATNLFNDAIDFSKGADNEQRIGPKRFTQQLSVKKVTMMALIFCGLALCLGLPLVFHAGWPIVIVGLLSLFFAFGYTGGPLPLAYKGLGDLFVIIFFGVIAVGVSHYILTLTWSFEAFYLGIQIGLLATVLIAVNNLRDSDGDRLVHKKTLAVRFGDLFVKREIFVLIQLALIMNLYWLINYNWHFVILFLPAWFALKILAHIFNNPDKATYNTCLGQAAAMHAAFGLLFCIGVWL